MPELSTQCSVNVICENNTGLDNIDIGDKIFFWGGGGSGNASSHSLLLINICKTVKMLKIHVSFKKS